MTYQIRLTRRALRDLTRIYQRIQAGDDDQSLRWFNGLAEAIDSLEQHPNRSPTTPEDKTLRHLLYGRKPNVYRIIYEVEKRTATVNVLHIRHAARKKMPR